MGLLAQKPGADAMEGPGPSQGRRCDRRVRPKSGGNDALHSPRHLAGCAPRKCQQEYSARISSMDDQVRNAMSDSVRFPRTRTRDDQKRFIRIAADAMLDRTALVRIEPVDIESGHGERESICVGAHHTIMFPFRSQLSLVGLTAAMLGCFARPA